MRRLAPERLASDVQALLAAGRLGPDEPALVVHDLGLLAENVRRVQGAFPPGTLHALAIKANPLVAVLREAVAWGVGLEAASLEEVHLARTAGCAPERIVFDSPAKTAADLDAALRWGVRINADSPEELERIAASPALPGSRSVIGLRVNPLVGEGAIATTSVAHAGSRFGVPLREGGRALLPLFRAYPWLTGLHVHVGSQGCTLDQLVAGARVADQARALIDAALGAGRVATLDVGGGLPAAYSDTAQPPSPEAYAARLRAEVAGLFAPGLQLVTEFGRSLQAGCGWAVSRVVYVKADDRRRVAVIHLGADMFLRTAYRPQEWPHEFLVLDAAGRLKEGVDTLPCDVAGPLCFAGDVIGRDLHLPAIAPDDLIVVRDAGAYTLGMWSRHCSRRMPAVLGREPGEPASFRVLRPGETLEDLAAFWGEGRQG